MSWLANALTFMAEPWFAIPWFSIGAVAAVWVVYDSLAVNKPLNPPLKAGWPIIMFFFSVIGVALYWVTARPLDIGRYQGEAALERFTEYSKPMPRKTVAAAIHCVAGDGLGIVTAMLILRFVGVKFWTEFWWEYFGGFVIGWFIFQTWSMRMHGMKPPMAILMAFRAEFFSMLTVMTGMGLTMAYITPAVVGEQPEPTTLAFWSFAALGLFNGFILTIPMNFMMVMLGWKHGQGRDYTLKMIRKQRAEKERQQERSHGQHSWRSHEAREA